MVNYLHIVSLTIAFDLDWPKLVKKYFYAQGEISSGSDQFFSMDCFLQSKYDAFYAKIIIVSVIPIISCVVVLLFWMIWNKFRKTDFLKEKIFGSLVVQLFFFHPSILKYNFSMFDCKELFPNSEYLTSDLVKECWKDEHLFYTFSIVVPSLILFCIALPILLIFYLNKNSSNLSDIKQRLILGFLYKGYDKKFFYWEFIIISRKLLIITLFVFLSHKSIPIQALSTFAVVLISLILQIKCKPYTNSNLNILEIISITVSGITLYSGLYFLTRDMDEIGKILFFLLILVSNSIFASFWIYLTLGAYITKLFSKYEFFRKIFKIKEKIKINPEIKETVLDITSNNSHIQNSKNCNTPVNELEVTEL